MLLDRPGIDPDVSERVRIRPRPSGQTSLSYAATNGHVNIVHTLLATNRVNVESRDSRDWTPLTYAAVKGQGAVIEVLITVPGIQLDSRERRGYTPMMRAAMEDHEIVAPLSLEKEGVDADAMCSSQCTALFLAAENGHCNVTKLLLDKGCSPYTQSRTSCMWMGPTPLCKAVQGGHGDIVQPMQQSKHRPRAPPDFSVVSEQVRARLRALYGNRQHRQHRQHSE